MAAQNATVIICIRCEGRVPLEPGSRHGAGAAHCPVCGAAYTWYRVPEGIVLQEARVLPQ